jgi:hypothetical protein
MDPRIWIRTKISWIRNTGPTPHLKILYILVNQSTKTPELSIRIGFNANPDAALWFNADPDPGDPGFFMTKNCKILKGEKTFFKTNTEIYLSPGLHE